MPPSRNLASKSALAVLFLCLALQVARTDDAPKKDADATPDPEEMEEQAGKINIAVPLHEPVKGIHLPFYDLKGTAKMQFDAEIANRTSNDIVEMKVLKIQTFDAKGRRDMLVSFPSATYDTANSVIKSSDSVEVRRNDFVLTGVGMEFDTKKRTGRVFSNIRMEIFGQSADTAAPTPTPNGP